MNKADRIEELQVENAMLAQMLEALQACVDRQGYVVPAMQGTFAGLIAKLREPALVPPPDQSCCFDLGDEVNRWNRSLFPDIYPRK